MLRHFFDALVMRHAVALNPFSSVRGKKHAAAVSSHPSHAGPRQPSSSSSSAYVAFARSYSRTSTSAGRFHSIDRARIIGRVSGR